MRIAQVAPLFESVPPRAYGGTERIVSYLTEALVELGHEVTLFAANGSRTRARLCVCADAPLRAADCRDPLARHILQFERVARAAESFDIVHLHTDWWSFPIARRIGTPSVTTLHGRLDSEELPPVYDEYCECPIVSISDSQRRPLPHASWWATVHHGLPPSLYRAGRGRGGYLAFLGRIAPEKGVDRAIDIAIAAGLPIRIGAKVDAADRDYFEREIQKRLSHPLVTFAGEIDDRTKAGFLGDAMALLFPIDWPEPFGLVMIEAMACGTPVVAFAHGSVPEVIDDGITGFIVDDVTSAADAVRRVHTLDRARVRACFDRRFAAERMTGDYLTVYEALLAPFAHGLHDTRRAADSSIFCGDRR